MSNALPKDIVQTLRTVELFEFYAELPRPLDGRNMWAQLNVAQYDTLVRYIRGQTVYDLGCGDGDLAIFCAKNGASKVVAIDKDVTELKLREEARLLPKLEVRRGNFFDLKDPMPIALFSWPCNRPHYNYDYVRLLNLANKMIIIAKNTDTTCCGNPEMWQWLTSRKLLKYVPDKKNTLFVYKNDPVRRKAVYEETAGIDMSKVYAFKEAR